jgi:hypothetical protein
MVVVRLFGRKSHLSHGSGTVDVSTWKITCMSSLAIYRLSPKQGIELVERDRINLVNR